MCNIESAVNTFQRIRHVRDQLVGSHVAFCLSVDGGLGGGGGGLSLQGTKS